MDCGGGEYRTPSSKPTAGALSLRHLPTEDLGGRGEPRTFGARMRRTFIPAQPWRESGLSPPAGDTHTHTRASSPGFGPRRDPREGRAAGGPLRAPRGRISFQPLPPGRGTRPENPVGKTGLIAAGETEKGIGTTGGGGGGCAPQSVPWSPARPALPRENFSRKSDL